MVSKEEIDGIELNRALKEFSKGNNMIFNDYNNPEYFTVKDLDGNLLVSLTKNEYEQRLADVGDDVTLFHKELIATYDLSDMCGGVIEVNGRN